MTLVLKANYSICRTFFLSCQGFCHLFMIKCPISDTGLVRCLGQLQTRVNSALMSRCASSRRSWRSPNSAWPETPPSPSYARSGSSAYIFTAVWGVCFCIGTSLWNVTLCVQSRALRFAPKLTNPFAVQAFPNSDPRPLREASLPASGWVSLPGARKCLWTEKRGNHRAPLICLFCLWSNA